MAQVDYYLKLEGIDGESSAKGHEKQIELDSFSWGATNASSAGSGGGGGTGKVHVHDLNFTAKVGKHSVKLKLACCNGEHIKKAEIFCRKAGKEQHDYYKITLSDVLISSYQVAGHQGSVIPLEDASFKFSKIEWEYKPQKDDGTLDSPVKAGWHVGQAQKV
jgi:type VI secretion system secreted protein Hcp